MNRFWKSLCEKGVDKVIDWMIPLSVAGMSWFFCSSLWAGWRSIAIAISAGACVFCLILVYRREQRAKRSGPQQTKPWKNPPDDGETELLLGSWTVQKNSEWEPNYLAVWTFSANQTVVVKKEQYEEIGKWEILTGRVLVTWKSLVPHSQRTHCWDTFLRPIDRNSLEGDAWDGPRVLKATKNYC